MPITQEIQDVAHLHFENPGLLPVAVGVALAGIGIEVAKRRVESEAEQHQGYPIADPEVAQKVAASNHRYRFREQVGMYVAVATIMFGVADRAEPYTIGSQVGDGITVVIDGSYASEVQDMKDGHKTTSRLDASIAGSLQAAAANDVPFSFILEGSNVEDTIKTPATGKDIAATQKQLESALGPELQNGESFADAVSQAINDSGKEGGKIITLASNLGVGNGDDASSLRKIAAETKRNGSNAKLYAVVVGNGQGEHHIGQETIMSPVDANAFEKVFGKKQVTTAQSTTAIADKISEISKASETTEHKSDSKLFGDLFIVGAVTGAGLAIRRRLAGITSNLKGRK